MILHGKKKGFGFGFIDEYGKQNAISKAIKTLAIQVVCAVSQEQN